MKHKALVMLLTIAFLATTAWFVDRSGVLQTKPGHFVPVAQGGEKKPGDDETTNKYRDTARRGLEFLLTKQHADGHWEGDDGQHPVAMAGLVGLALLMDQAHPRKRTLNKEGKHAAAVEKAADWLIKNAEAGREGLIFSEHPSETGRYMEGHGLATIFLAGLLECHREGERDLVARAVKYIVKAQSTQGGWYHTSKVEGHDFAAVLPTVIQVQALLAADNAGVAISDETLEAAQGYLVNATEKPARERLLEIAGAFACRTVGRYGKTKELDKAFALCQKEIAVGRKIALGRDDLTHYYYAQALFNQRGEAWMTYRAATFEHLKGSQNKDGSWPASKGISVGPVYATALWCTVLQLDNNCHPSNRFDDIVK